MPTTTTMYRDPSHPRADQLGRVQEARVGRVAPRRQAPPRMAQRSPKLGTIARAALLTAYAVGGTALALWALLNRGPFY